MSSDSALRPVRRLLIVSAVVLWPALACACQARTVAIEDCSTACAAEAACNEAACVTSDENEVGLVLDDFEDGDPYPRDTSYDVWHSYTYNAGPQHVGFVVAAPGSFSETALHLQWDIRDPSNGGPDYGLAGLDTTARGVAKDLSAFSEVVFSHLFENLDEQCKPATDLTFGFYCAEHEADFVTQVPLSPGWQVAEVPFSDFREVTWRPPKGIPVTDCLASDTTLYFEVAPELQDGECGTGRLSLDTILLR